MSANTGRADLPGTESAINRWGRGGRRGRQELAAGGEETIVRVSSRSFHRSTGAGPVEAGDAQVLVIKNRAGDRLSRIASGQGMQNIEVDVFRQKVGRAVAEQP